MIETIDFLLMSSSKNPMVAASSVEEFSPVNQGAMRRVVIVEDEILVAWHLESLLQEMHMEVCGIASNWADAIDLVLTNDVELVFMDVNLQSSIDGIETAERILEKRKVHIIFVTAYADKSTQSKIRSTVPSAPVVSKPATPAAIRLAMLKLSAA